MLQNEGTSGLPLDLITTNNPEPEIMFKNQTYWLGEHSHGYITLKEFCDIDKEPPKGFQVYEDDENNWHIVIGGQDSWDIDYTILDLQKAFRTMFAELEDYRLIIGFDS